MQTATALECKNLVLDPVSAAAWPLFSPDRSPADVYQELTAGLPENTQLTLGIKQTGQLEYIEYRNDGFFSNHYILGSSALYSKAEVEPSAQGKGISATINDHLFDLYKKIGIEEMCVNAADVGVYAWARAGFVPKQETWMNIIRPEAHARFAFLQEHPHPNDPPLSHSTISALKTALASDDAKSFWTIVDQTSPCHGTTLGKALSLPLIELPRNFPAENMARHGAGNLDVWYGTLDMQDPDCTGRFSAKGSPAAPLAPVPLIAESKNTLTF